MNLTRTARRHGNAVMLVAALLLAVSVVPALAGNIQDGEPYPIFGCEPGSERNR